MYTDTESNSSGHPIHITDEVRSYVLDRKQDFRVSTSCGGPILLPTSIKPPKISDIRLHVGDYTIYISRYQARYLETVHRGMISFFFDY